MPLLLRLSPVLTGLLALGLAQSAAAAPGKPRVVVELFTSQGCSSCPPADKLLTDLARDPGVLALTMPVDYWDYLGWKDTLAERAFTERQKAYGEIRGDRQVYTPQAVINGVAHAVGSNADAITSAAKTDGAHGSLSIPLTIETTATSVKVSVPAQPGAAPATVFLFPVMKRMEVAIGRGENKGQTVTYTNVVREVVPMGTWKGEAKTFEVSIDQLSKGKRCDTYAAVLQAGGPGKPGVILGAVRAADF
jgi:hypothetical protein